MNVVCIASLFCKRYYVFQEAIFDFGFPDKGDEGEKKRKIHNSKKKVTTIFFAIKKIIFVT